MSQSFETILKTVMPRAMSAGVFASVAVNEGELRGRALGPEAHAEFRLFVDGGRAWVSLVTPDRWLSQSIEADLMFTGDKLEDLIDEELVDQGVDVSTPIVEHFRSEDKLFTFRTPMEGVLDASTPEAAAARAVGYLLAYEAAFRELGDMKPGEDDA